MPIPFTNSIDLAKNEIQNAVIQPLASAPSSPVEGQFYYNTTDDTVYVRANGAWLDLGVQGGAGATDLTHTLTSTTVSINSNTGADTTIGAADGTNAGIMTSAQSTKLSGIATGATANSSDATLLNRTNHTGNQAISTVTGLQTALDGKAASTHSHVSSDITDFTSAVTAIADASAAAIVDSAPGTLDTLNELAAALGDDPNFATTVSNQIAGIDGRVDAIEANGGPIKKYATSVGGSTSIVVTHNLGTQDVTVSVRDATTHQAVMVDWTASSTSAVTLSFSVAPAANQYRVVVQG